MSTPIGVLALLIVWGWVTPALAATATLSWKDNSDDEDGFFVERKTEPCTGTGAFAQVGTVAANVQTFVDATFQEGATYCYRVAAGNAAGKSYSAAVQFHRPLAPTVPQSPTNLQIVLGLIPGFLSIMVWIGGATLGASSVIAERGDGPVEVA